MKLRPRFQHRERSTPEPVHLIRAHERQVHQLQFLNEDSFITAGEDGQLLRIGIDGRIIRAFDGHDGSPVNCLTVIDADRFATGGDDGSVRVWNAAGSCELVLEHHGAYVRSVAAHGRRLVSVGEDRTIAFWDLEDGTLFRVEQLNEGPSAVEISPAGKVVVATLDNALVVFDASTGEPLEPLYQSDAMVAHVGRMYLALPNTSGVGHVNPPRRLLFLADGTLLSAGNEILGWDMTSRVQRLVRNLAWAPESMAACSDGLWVASLDFQKVSLDGRMIGWLPAPEERGSAIAVSPDGRWIVGAGENGVIVIYGSDAISSDSDRHREVARDLVLSPDGGLAVTIDSENTSLVWSTATGEMIARIEQPTMGSCPAAFTADGSLITVGKDPESSMTLRRPTGEPLLEFELDVDDRRIHPHALAPHPDGRLLVGALGPHLSCFARGGAGRRTFTGRTQQISEIHLAPDGETAVTIGYFAEVEPEPGASSLGDNSSKLQAWDLARGELLWTISAQHPVIPEKKYVIPYSFGFVALSAHGVISQSGDAEDRIVLRELRTAAERWRVEARGYPSAWSLEGDRLELLLSRKDELPLLCTIDVAQGRCMRSIEIGAPGMQRAAFVGRSLAVTKDGVMLVFDVESGVLVERVEDVHATVLAVRGGVLVATTRDGRIAAFS